MRALILSAVAIIVVVPIAFGVAVLIVFCRWDGSCGAPEERSAQWVRKEVRVGMHVPELVKLAESDPFNSWWIVSLEDCAAPPADSFYMHADGNGYVGVTVTRGSFDRSEQQFQTREELFAAVPYHFGCRKVDISYPHWRVPVALSADARVEEVFDPVWID